jgi:pimeloyl-ACP methyl ester carboxylesterase
MNLTKGMRESGFRFGEQQRLYGVLTLPAQHDAGRPVVVIPNTGFEHHVGPNRLHVQMARALAAAGFTVLRFDIAGLGDSDALPGTATDPVADVQRALDFLDSRYPASRYAIVAVCSGAHLGHQVCRVDPRVTSLFSIDGYAFPNAKFQQLQWRMRLAQPLRSTRKLLGRLFPSLELAQPQGSEVAITIWPSQPEVAADYEQFLKRGLQLSFMFTGGFQAIYLYAEQHHDVFPQLKGRAPVSFLPHADHTLSRRAAREQVIDAIRQWLLGQRSP